MLSFSESLTVPKIVRNLQLAAQQLFSAAAQSPSQKDVVQKSQRCMSCPSHDLMWYFLAVSSNLSRDFGMHSQPALAQQSRGISSQLGVGSQELLGHDS